MIRRTPLTEAYVFGAHGEDQCLRERFEVARDQISGKLAAERVTSLTQAYAALKETVAPEYCTAILEGMLEDGYTLASILERGNEPVEVAA